LHNAKIATNGVPSFVEAIAITAGRIAAVGEDEEILRLRGPQTRIIDGRRRTIGPLSVCMFLVISVLHRLLGLREKMPGACTVTKVELFAYREHQCGEGILDDRIVVRFWR
jgi:hypothetical protein